jgi:putative phosphoesterase
VECVRGNHEDLLARLMREPSNAADLHRRYGSALAQAASGLSPQHLAYLERLPVRKEITIEGRRILLCHGSPWDPDLYVYPDAAPETFERCAASGADIVVMGHTHYQLMKASGSTTIVNPGSVGQPRDRQPGAAWALLDTDTGSCRAFTEPYDSRSIEAQARVTDPHLPYLWEVLNRR